MENSRVPRTGKLPIGACAFYGFLPFEVKVEISIVESFTAGPMLGLGSMVIVCHPLNPFVCFTVSESAVEWDEPE